MVAMEQESKKKATKKVEDMTAPERMIAANTPPPLAAVKPAPTSARPGDKDFDWQAEYPGEDIYVYTVPKDAKMSPAGKQSPPGLTIGLARLTEDRAPNPGEMEEADEKGGFAPMWVFIRAVSSPTSRQLQKLLRPAEYNEMLRGWADFAGIELSK